MHNNPPPKALCDYSKEFSWNPPIPGLDDESYFYSPQLDQQQRNPSVIDPNEMNELPPGCVVSELPSESDYTYIFEAPVPYVIDRTPAELPTGCDTAISELFRERYQVNAPSASSRRASSGTCLSTSSSSSYSRHDKSPSAVHAGTGGINIETSVPLSATRVSMRHLGRAHMTTVYPPSPGSPSKPSADSYSLDSTMNDVQDLGAHVSTRTLQQQNGRVTKSSRRQNPLYGQVYNDSLTALLGSQAQTELEPTQLALLPSSRRKSSQPPLPGFTNTTPIGNIRSDFLDTAAGMRSPMLPRYGPQNSQNSQSSPVNDCNVWQDLTTSLEQSIGFNPQMMSPSRSVSSSCYEMKPDTATKESLKPRSGESSAKHIAIEEEDDRSKCKCGAKFKGKLRVRNSNLQRHINSTTASLHCPRGCGRTFSRSDNLKSHTRSCTGSTT